MVVLLGILSLTILAGFGLLHVLNGEDANVEIQKEDGILENLTALFFAAGGVIFLHGMLSKNFTVKDIFKEYRLLLIILGFLCIFAALEEISFGQRIIGWDSPEYFEDNSTQEETDFHNFPALSILFGIAAMVLVIYGVIVPYGFWKQHERFTWFRQPFGIKMIYPPVQSAVFFFLGIVCILIDSGTKYVLDNQFVANEYQEFLFAFGFLSFSFYLNDARFQKQYSSSDDGKGTSDVGNEKNQVRESQNMKN